MTPNITRVNLASVDLNLLVVLDAVLDEGSATRAAARLHVTQSAVSNALKRLRELFGDPLVVRRPGGLAPTARALALAPQLQVVLEGARSLLAPDAAFDPRTTTRTFTLACSDAVAVVLLRPLLAELESAMPAARLRLVTIERLVATDGLVRGEVDLQVGIPPVLPPGCTRERLYDDPMRCIVRRDHPARRLTIASYAALPHVEVALFGAHDETVDRALARSGHARAVRVSVAHFSSIPLAVLATSCVATLSGRIATAFAAQLPLRVMHPPVRLPTLGIDIVSHRRSASDPGVAVLRRALIAAARSGAAISARPAT